MVECDRPITWRMLSAHDVSNIAVDQLSGGVLPYLPDDAEVIGDVKLTWASSHSDFSATGYVRNVGNNQYKTTASPGFSGAQPMATLYDPRAYGIVLNARF